jgi:hypothetical protein
MLPAVVLAALALAPARWPAGGGARLGRARGRLAMQVRAPDERTSGQAVSQLSSQMAGMREQFAADPRSAAMMQALRGSNLNDDEIADVRTRLMVVEMSRGVGDDVLPLIYAPDRLAAYFARRPGAVATRVGQVFSTSFGWLCGVAWAAARGQMTAGSDGEVEQVRCPGLGAGFFSNVRPAGAGARSCGCGWRSRVFSFMCAGCGGADGHSMW